MHWLFEHLHALLNANQAIPLFLSLALGYRLGKVKFGKFQLGGVAGSLLVAVIISQLGVTADDGLKGVLFALFIYAVGYESGPQFFRALNRSALREIFLALCLAVTGLLTVVVLAKLFGFDKGLAAGIAAGGLTQSAIIGTASDALSRMGLDAETLKTMQQNVAIGYAVTYIFGSLGTIIVCVNILPKFMGRTIRDDAVAAAANFNSKFDALKPGEDRALEEIVGRVYTVPQGFAKTVRELEQDCKESPVTVEKIKRAKKQLDVGPEATLQGGDEVLIVGRRDAILNAAKTLGEEQIGDDDMQLTLVHHDVTLTSDAMHNQPVVNLRDALNRDASHGVYVMGVSRNGQPVKVGADTQLRLGDVVNLYGSPQDVTRAAGQFGNVVVTSNKTDMIYMSVGLIVGLLIGLITVRIAGLPMTLGSGGGCLLSGLLFGWYRSRHPGMGWMPSGASQFLKDFGLAGFVVVVGLASGLQAVETMKKSGLDIFVAGCIVTVLPLLITMAIGRYIIGYKNSAVFSGALAGSRSANPAFGEILNKAGNSVPTVPFAITYALANVFLTLVGPLVVALA